MAVEWLSNAGYNIVLREPHGLKGEALAIKWLYESGDRIYNFTSLKGKIRTESVLI
jgi:hypothetical protein